MRRSFFSISTVTIAFALAIASCAARNHKKVLPAASVRTATMDITPGIEVLTHVALPDGFVPAPAYPPIWLQNGKEVAVVGTRSGHTAVVGYGGIGYRTERVIAEDEGVGAPGRRIVDLSPSLDGMVLALAVMPPKEKRLDVVTRDLISEGSANPVSSFDGEFDSVSLGWRGQFTIGLALRTRLGDEVSSAAPPGSTPATFSAAQSGIYTIYTSGVVTTGYLKLNCKLSKLEWASDGGVAVGTGDASAPPVIIDRGKESCERINAQPPIRVLDWAHDGKSFLYKETNPAIGTGTYRY